MAGWRLASASGFVFGSLSLSQAPAPRGARPANAMNFRCQWLRRHGSGTLFGIEDEVAERWPAEHIQMIEWRVDEATTRQGSHKGSSLADRRLDARAARRGAPWTDEEDAKLREEHAPAMSLDEMANLHERNAGGIRSRLVRLGLLRPETRDQASPGEQ